MKLQGIISMIRASGYKVFDKPYQLNILGLRSRSTKPNSFDDEIHVFFKKNAATWEHHIFKATTDPGTFWLKNPASPQGTAILAQGQYENSYQVGLHQGKYTALVQRAPVKVLRDYDRNAVLDFLNGAEYSGLFGINIHRASVSGTTKTVDKYSAGCQVFANVSDFDVFLKFCEKHKELYGNQFTYTLLDFRAVARLMLRRATISALIAGVSTAGILLYDQYSN